MYQTSSVRAARALLVQKSDHRHKHGPTRTRYISLHAHVAMVSISEPAPERGALSVRIVERRPTDNDTWCLLQSVSADDPWELWMLDANMEALESLQILLVVS